MQPLKPAFVRCLCYRKPGGSRTTRASVSWRSFAAVEDSFLQRSFEWRLCLSQKSQNCVTKNKTTKKIELSSLVTQWVKDLVLLLLWLWLLQWCEFSHWPANFHMLWAWSKKKKKIQPSQRTHSRMLQLLRMLQQTDTYQTRNQASLCVTFRMGLLFSFQCV